MNEMNFQDSENCSHWILQYSYRARKIVKLNFFFLLWRKRFTEKRHAFTARLDPLVSEGRIHDLCLNVFDKINILQ